MPALGTPAVGRNADGRLEVIAVDAGASLGHVWQTSPGGGWSGWATYGGTTSTRQPDVGVNVGGRLEVFTAGVNDRVLYHASQRRAPNSGRGSAAPAQRHPGGPRATVPGRVEPEMPAAAERGLDGAEDAAPTAAYQHGSRAGLTATNRSW